MRLRFGVLGLLAVAAGCDAGSVLSPAGQGPEVRSRSIRPVSHDAKTLIVGRPSDALSLDPARVTDNESVEVIEQLYDKLLYQAPGESEIRPGLATAWDSTEGGRVWTFELRRDVTFHDGTPLTADAVVFSFERQRDPAHPYYDPDYQWASVFSNILDITAVDDYTVRIQIDEPYAPFVANMAMFPVAIVSPAAFERRGADGYGDHPVGTGPFKFVSWDKGERIVLERNEHYWRGAPTIERVVFQTIEDGRQRLVSLESGALDIAYSILPEELQFVELHPDLELLESPANNVTYLAMNTTHPPFDDVRVRRAANLAINKEPIVKLLYQGQAIAAEGPLPPTQWGYAKLDDPYPYDPEAARALLAEAEADGVFDPRRRYSFYVPSTPRPYLPDPEGVARVLEAHLAAVGIRTKKVVQPFEQHIADSRAGVHDLVLLGWVGDNGDPDNFLFVLFDSKNAQLGTARNVAFFRDPVLHGLLSWAQQSQDREEREHYYERAQKLIHEAAPWVPLAHSQVSIAARRDLGGLAVNPSGHIAYREVLRKR